MPHSASLDIRLRRAVRAASFVLAACALPRAARAQEVAQTPATHGSIVIAGSKLSEVLDAAALSDAPRPFARFTDPTDAIRDSVVALARAQIGRRYVRGGTSPDHGFDCSGLVKYVLGLLDVVTPRTARQQARLGEAVPKDRDDLKPGDLLTFGRSSQGASHVAIYVGDGHYVHASVAAGRVIESTLDRRGSSLVRAWRGVRRLFAAADSSEQKGDSLIAVAPPVRTPAPAKLDRY